MIPWRRCAENQEGIAAMDDLAYLSAVEAREAFRARKMSPVEVLDALIARDAAIGDINAFSWRFFDEAQAAAREAENRYMGKGAPHVHWKGLRSPSRRTKRLRGNL